MWRKRVGGYGADGDQDSKRLRLGLEEDATPGATVEAEFYLEQHLVGWVLGRGGAASREVEGQYRVRLFMDQSTKAQGYSKLKITGDESNVLEAADAINGSLAHADCTVNSGIASDGPFLLDAPPTKTADFVTESMRIPQQYVGWLVGKSGGVVREIEERAGCKVLIDQGTKSLGYSTMQFLGHPDQVFSAQQMVEESLERAKASSQPPAVAASDRVGPGGVPSVLEESMQVEQAWVGWLLGKGGALVRELEQESGCRISFDQSTRDMGYSTIHLRGDQGQIQAATRRIEASLEAVGGKRLDAGNSGNHGGTVSVQMTIEQQWVGWVLGKGGCVMKEIEESSGATISLNQETKDEGYSVATIKGTLQQTAKAKEIISEKLRQVCRDSENPPAVTLGSGVVGSKISIGGALRNSHRPHATGGGAGWSSSDTSLRGGNSVGSPAMSTGDIQIDQACVGWILGKGGAVLKEIEAASGAKVSLDQSTKQMGYSTAQITGMEHQVQEAARLIEDKVAQADPNHGGGVGSHADGSSPQVKEGDIVEAYWEHGDKWLPAQASIVQHDGTIVVVWSNGRSCSLPADYVRQAEAPDDDGPLGPPVGHHGHGGSTGSSCRVAGADLAGDMEVEQRFVPWILGKSGVVLKDIEHQCGAVISIDQSTRDQGYSTVRVRGSTRQQIEANALIRDKIAQSSSLPSPAPTVIAPPAASPGGFQVNTEMSIEQRMVGWVLGKSGVVLREIESMSGARISIDQGTRDLGFSTARIAGTAQQAREAQSLIEDKIAAASGAY